MGLDSWAGVLFWATLASGASIVIAFAMQLLAWYLIVGSMTEGLLAAFHTPQAPASLKQVEGDFDGMD